MSRARFKLPLSSPGPLGLSLPGVLGVLRRCTLGEPTVEPDLQLVAEVEALDAVEASAAGELSRSA